jgi:hypothetical protein
VRTAPAELWYRTRKMSDYIATPVHSDNSPPGATSAVRQFRALMYKNFLVQVRSRLSVFGFRLGGVATVLFEVLVPVLFIGAMCLVARLPATHIPPMVFKSWPLSDPAWAGKQKGVPLGPQGVTCCVSCLV